MKIEDSYTLADKQTPSRDSQRKTSKTNKRATETRMRTRWRSSGPRWVQRWDRFVVDSGVTRQSDVFSSHRSLGVTLVQSPTCKKLNNTSTSRQMQTQTSTGKHREAQSHARMPSSRRQETESEWCLATKCAYRSGHDQLG